MQSLRLHTAESSRVRVRAFPLRFSASAPGSGFNRHPPPPNNSFKPTPCRGVGHVLCATLAHVRRPATGRLNSSVRPAMTEQLGWMWEENLRPFLDYVASSLNYDMASEELEAHMALTSASDAEKDLWHQVDFRGCALYLAPDQGTYVVHVKADTTSQHTEQLRGIVSFLACYSVATRA
jgi:hypothetical protein